jgi:hypothetical protein
MTIKETKCPDNKPWLHEAWRVGEEDHPKTMCKRRGDVGLRRCHTTTFSAPRARARPTRSGMVCGTWSASVVTGRRGRGLMPCRPSVCMSLATVLVETASPSSRRSAVILGAPFTPSLSSWSFLIVTSRLLCRCARGEGPAAWP